MVSRTGQDGIKTSIPMNEKHDCPCMLNDLSSARSRASIEPQKGRSPNEARATKPHSPRPTAIVFFFFFVKLDGSRLFGMSALPTEVAFGTLGSLLT